MLRQWPKHSLTVTGRVLTGLFLDRMLFPKSDKIATLVALSAPAVTRSQLQNNRTTDAVPRAFAGPDCHC